MKKIILLVIAFFIVWLIIPNGKKSNQQKEPQEYTKERLKNLVPALEVMIGEGMDIHASSAEIQKFIMTHPNCCSKPVVLAASNNRLFRDGWDNEMVFTPTESIILRSAGPDQVMNTADDIIFSTGDSEKDKYANGLTFRPNWSISTESTSISNKICDAAPRHILEEYKRLLTDDRDSALTNMEFWTNTKCSPAITVGVITLRDGATASFSCYCSERQLNINFIHNANSKTLKANLITETKSREASKD